MSAILIDEQMQQEEDTSALQAARDLSNNQMRHEEVKEELEGESASLRPGDQQDFMDDDDDCFREVVDNLDAGASPKPRSKSERPTIGSLQEEVEILRAKLEKSDQHVESLLQELKRAQEEIARVQEEAGEEGTVIAHIKGTLFQFLKKCPLTEKTNEDLLNPIYGMMEFSPNEIQELKIARINMGQKGAKAGKGSGLLSTSTQSLSREDDTGSQKPKRGFKNLFGLKKDSGKDSRDQNTSGAGKNSSDGINLKPIRR